MCARSAASTQLAPNAKNIRVFETDIIHRNSFVREALSIRQRLRRPERIPHLSISANRPDRYRSLQRKEEAISIPYFGAPRVSVSGLPLACIPRWHDSSAQHSRQDSFINCIDRDEKKKEVQPFAPPRGAERWIASPSETYAFIRAI